LAMLCSVVIKPTCALCTAVTPILNIPDPMKHSPCPYR
jgi:hypothetical protein